MSLGMQPQALLAGKFILQVALRRASQPRVVGVTGVEPVTLRLSSACSNQLSYTPILSLNCLMQFQPKVGGAEETRTPDL
jgi:hypothetical protein